MSTQLLSGIRARAGRVKRGLKRIFTPNAAPVGLSADQTSARREIAAKYIQGRGIEIGALHQPLPLPAWANVRYVDRMDVAGLRAHYPELAQWNLVPIDIIDDGEKLGTFKEASEDFVVASHLIEHTQDPIGSIKNWLRVLKPGGVLYLGVPHKEFTFDKDRPLTPLEHIVRDHAEGPQNSRRGHYEEWTRLVDKVKEEDCAKRAAELEARDYSIHFHVWTEFEFLELMLHCMRVEKMPFSLEHFQRNGMEFIVILRKK